MKVGILTYHFANNYGAALQAYAIQTVLTENGHEAEIIDYISNRQKSNNSIWEKNDNVKSIIKNIIRIPQIKNRKTRIEKFENFRNSFLLLSKNEFDNKSILKDYIENNIDMVSVGSDQVWNVNTDDFDEIYFEISDQKKPVVAYATSIGNSTIEDLHKYIDCMKAFKSISTRETTTKNILSGITMRDDIVSVLDPTLLIDTRKYEDIANAGMRVNGDYIICYYLGRENAKDVIKCMDGISEKIGCPVYYINANNGIISYNKNAINDAGPEDFLSLIKNAKLVVTNSFHATVFSIKFNVPFYDLEKESSNDTRKSDLLKLLSIEGRAIFDYICPNEIKIDNCDIISASKKLESICAESLKYIGTAYCK